MTKKDAFVWGESAQEAFETLKTIMCSYPRLAIPDFSIPFTVECNASKFDVGVVLMQKGQPIAFESKKLTNAKHNFSVYEKEMLAIMHVLEKFK